MSRSRTKSDGIASRRAAPTASRQATVDAVATIVPRLYERGFECVTAGALLDDDGNLHA